MSNNDIVKQLNKILSLEVVATYPILKEKIERISPQLSSFDFTASSIYDIYFNESSISNGQGLNLLKTNSFCETIPREYIYPLVRDLLLDRISDVTEIGPTYEKQISLSVANLAVYLQARQREFDTWLPPIYEDPEIPEKTEIELFWEWKGLYDVDLRINGVETTIASSKSKITNLNNLVEQWTELGMSVALKIAIVQNVFAFSTIDLESEDLFTTLDTKQEFVKKYSADLINSLNIVKEILSENPVEDIENLFEKIRDKVLIELNVKNISNQILTQLKNGFDILVGDK